MALSEMAAADISREELSQMSERFEQETPHYILRWAITTYAPAITLACSFGGPSGIVLLDMARRIDPAISIFSLDTDFLFPETIALRDELVQQYNLNHIAYRPLLTPSEQAESHGEALWTKDPDRCCEIRKVEPNRRALAGMKAWITGIRRDQASTRKKINLVEWDKKFGLVKVNPLAHWDEALIWNYITENNIAYNPLHDRGYPSLGCTNCTRPVTAGEELRAGRWQGFAKTECGLHR